MGKYTLATLLPPDIFFAIKTTAFYPVLYQIPAVYLLSIHCCVWKSHQLPCKNRHKNRLYFKEKKAKKMRKKSCLTAT